VRPEVRLEPGCPWYGLSELRRPNVDWCELQRCSWIVEPANTWSNLSYLLVAVVLFAAARRSPSPHVRAFAPAAAFVGLASGIYHASYTFALQILDFAGMYVFCALMLTLAARRAGWIGPERWRGVLLGGVAAATALTVLADFTGLPIQLLVFALIVAIVVLELRLARATPGPGSTPPRLRAFSLGMLSIGAGSIFSLLDVSRLWCWPAHPFLQGHAIWHLLSALSLLACYAHYRQFESELTPPAPAPRVA
jgi:hypothetical protein